MCEKGNGTPAAKGGRLCIDTSRRLRTPPTPSIGDVLAALSTLRRTVSASRHPRGEPRLDPAPDAPALRSRAASPDKVRDLVEFMSPNLQINHDTKIHIH